MGVKVSIIVPVYNAEEYLEVCLNFLCNQTLDDIEIITVNDASTDKSLRILRKYQSKVSDKIKIINSKENLGPGGARNLGLQTAVGEYIGFVDCDDAVNKEMFEMLYDKAKEGNYDIVDCAYYHEENDDYYFPNKNLFIGEMTNEKKADLIRGCGFIWSKIFRKTIIDKMIIPFRQNVIYEDIDFLCDAYLKANRIGSVPKALYFYKCNPNSISKSPNLDKLYFSVENGLKAIKERTNLSELPNPLRKSVEFVMLNMSGDLLGGYASTDNFSLSDLQKFDNLLRQYIPDYENNEYINEFGVKEKTLLYSNISKDIDKSYKNILKLKGGK